MSQTNYKLAFVDDHPALIEGLIGLLDADLDMTEYDILFKANDGQEMQQLIDPENLPDLIIMDIDMKFMSGPESVKWLRLKYPSVKILVVSMHELPEKVIPMLELDVEGYMSKSNTDIGINVKAIRHGKICYDPFVQDILKNLSTRQGGAQHYSNFELDFFKMVCQDYKQKEIADKLNMTPKSIEKLFGKYYKQFDVQSRQTLALKLRELGLA